MSDRSQISHVIPTREEIHCQLHYVTSRHQYQNQTCQQSHLNLLGGLGLSHLRQVPVIKNFYLSNMSMESNFSNKAVCDALVGNLR